MIIALAGSCWSWCCSTRNSLDRWSAWANDSLSPVAWDVVIPHAVLVLIPALTDRLSPLPRDSLVCALREVLAGQGAIPLPGLARPDEAPRVEPSLVDHDPATELTDPAVLV
jgi:hypothetical protein